MAAANENSEKSKKKGVVNYTVVLVGISPLLMDPMDEETVIATLVNRERKPPAKDVTPRQIAENKLYKLPSGKNGIPSINVLACLREAGRMVKLDGRRAVSTAESTQLYAFLSTDQEYLEFAEDEQEWKHDVRRGVMKTTGKGIAVGIIRPKFNKWSLRIPIAVDYSVDGVSEEMVKTLFLEGGRRIGLCSFRPECNGQFGRFKLVKFEELRAEQEDQKAA